MSTEPSVHKNVEIKARIRDYDLMMGNVQELCQSHGEEIDQEDTFFNVQHGRLKLRKRQDYSVSELIFYDRPDIKGPKLSAYSKCKIQNGTDIIKVLEASLGIKGVVRKKRQLFVIDNLRIHLDTVDGLGKFVELEVTLNNHMSLDDGREMAESYMNTLGIVESDLIDRAYIDLLNQPSSFARFQNT